MTSRFVQYRLAFVATAGLNSSESTSVQINVIG